MRKINRMSINYVNAVRGAREYLMNRCSPQLLQLVVVGDGAHVGRAAYDGAAGDGCTLIAVYIADIIGNDDALYAIFRMHAFMSKASSRPARLIRDDLLAAGLKSERIQCKYIADDYSAIEKDRHGTAATPLEQVACDWLGYKWVGGLNHSALYEHESGARLGRKGGRAVPDGIRENGDALEVKCKRGRTTYISDCR